METARLILRRARKEDAPELYQYFNTDYVQQYNVMRPMSLEEYTDSLMEVKPSRELYLELKETGQVIGNISIDNDHIRARVKSVSLSYWLGEPFAGKGYMSEALRAVIGELEDYSVISARVFSENISSQRLLEKLGFEQEGYLKHAVRDMKNIIHDDILYAKINKPTST